MHRFAIILALIITLATTAWGADTTPPVIGSVEVLTPMVSPGDTVHVKVMTGDNVAVSTVKAGESMLGYTSPLIWEGDVQADPAYGEHGFMVTVTDSSGNTATDNSARYRTVPVFGIRSDHALNAPIGSFVADNLFTMWGTATYLDANSFELNDGGTATRVYSPRHGVCSGDYVVVKGTLDSSSQPAWLVANDHRMLKLGNKSGISLPSNMIVGKDLQKAVYASFDNQYHPALTITVTSLDPGKLLLSKSAAATGCQSITVDVANNYKQSPQFYIQGLADGGTADVLITAPGCLGTVATVTLAPSGICVQPPSYDSPGVVNTTTMSANLNLYVKPMRLNPSTLTPVENQQLRGGLSVQVHLHNSDPSVGSITLNSVVIGPGETQKQFQFDPTNPGMATISPSVPIGFSSVNGGSITVNVADPRITAHNVNVGLNLQTSSDIRFEVKPPSPVTITVSVDNPDIAAITSDPNATGTNSVTFANVSSIGNYTYYIQGINRGSTEVNIQAAGYTTITKTITVDPSGFVVESLFPTNKVPLHNGMRNIIVRPVRLNPVDFNIGGYQNIRSGAGNVDVQLTNSDPSVGSITANQLTFTGNSGTKSTMFQATALGVTTISIVTPNGFATPSTSNQLTVTVVKPEMNIMLPAAVGRDLQADAYIRLFAVPPQPVDITLSVDDPSIATITRDPVVAGTGTLVIPGVNHSSQITYYLQGRSIGTTTLRASAPGFEPCSLTVNVRPSGFKFEGFSIGTTPLAADTQLIVQPAMLDPDDLFPETTQALRGGINGLEIYLTNSNPEVGTLTPNPVLFSANEYRKYTYFDPIAIGTTTLSIVTPAGFQTPSFNYRVEAGVSEPNISCSYDITGYNLQTAGSFRLEVAPPTPVDVTVTVADPQIATVSADPNLDGTSSITFAGVDSTVTRYFYIQGKGVGITTLTASAPGYRSQLTNTCWVYPSGFWITPHSVDTRVSASDTILTIKSVRLSRGSLDNPVQQPLRAGLSVAIPLNLSHTNVGILSQNPVVISGGQYYASTAFHPLAMGLATVSVVESMGFVNPSLDYFWQTNIVVKP